MIALSIRPVVYICLGFLLNVCDEPSFIENVLFTRRLFSLRVVHEVRHWFVKVQKYNSPAESRRIEYKQAITIMTQFIKRPLLSFSFQAMYYLQSHRNENDQRDEVNVGLVIRCVNPHLWHVRKLNLIFEYLSDGSSINSGWLTYWLYWVPDLLSALSPFW